MKLIAVFFVLVAASGCASTPPHSGAPALWISNGATVDSITVEAKDLELRAVRIAVAHRCKADQVRSANDEKLISVKFVDARCETVLKALAAM